MIFYNIFEINVMLMTFRYFLIYIHNVSVMLQFAMLQRCHNIVVMICMGIVRNCARNAYRNKFHKINKN